MTQISINLPLLHLSSSAARRMFETDPFENDDDSPWIAPDAGWVPRDVGHVDDVLRIIVGRDMFGPGAKVSYAWCGEDSDSTRVRLVQFALAVPGVEGVHLTSAEPVSAAALSALETDSALDGAVAVYEAVGAHLEGLLRQLTSGV